jgi:hypothetical protein
MDQGRGSDREPPVQARLEQAGRTTTAIEPFTAGDTRRAPRQAEGLLPREGHHPEASQGAARSGPIGRSGRRRRAAQEGEGSAAEAAGGEAGDGSVLGRPGKDAPAGGEGPDANGRAWSSPCSGPAWNGRLETGCWPIRPARPDGTAWTCGPWEVATPPSPKASAGPVPGRYPPPVNAPAPSSSRLVARASIHVDRRGDDPDLSRGGCHGDGRG